MDYRDYSNAQEMDDWKPVRDVPWSASRRPYDPYDSTHYGLRGDDDNDDRQSDGPTAAAATVSELPPSHYSTIKDLPAQYYYPTQPAADLQPTGTVTHWHQPLTPSYQPSGASYRPSPGAPNGNNYDYRPSRIAAAAAAEKKIAVPAASWAADAVDWKLIGAAALVKLGLAKLKAFALLNALLVLLFKVKAFAVAAVFKFALLLKLLKFFKTLSVPLLLAPLLALLSSPLALGALSAIPSRLLQSLLPPNNLSPAASAVPGLPGLSGLPGVLSPGQNVIGPAQALSPGQNVIGPSQALSPGGVPGSGRPTGRAGPALRPSAVAKSDGPSDSPEESFYPILDVFRDMLDSEEKCVDRIACRMAAAEKSGAMPSWINW